jgi:enoyl-CoA hydratase/carnithine racemase
MPSHPGIVSFARLAAGCVAVLLAVTTARAEPWGVGDRIAPMSFQTQHDETFVVGPPVRLVLITHDMGAGDVAKAVLAEHDAASLAARGAVYVADIARMPGLVSRFVAIPRMRNRPYPVLLDREAATARAFGVEDGAVTAVWLDDGRITRLERLRTEAALRAALREPDS